MKKENLSWFFVGLILILFSVNFSITGNAIGFKNGIGNLILFTLGLTVLMISLIVFVLNKNLEGLVIPTGGHEANVARTERAMERYSQYPVEKTPYVLISGEIKRDSRGKIAEDDQQKEIYKTLRRTYGLKPSDFMIEGKSKDSLENFLEIIEKAKKKRINHLEVSTNPTHYWRFKLFERQARREGLLDKDFEMRPIYTEENPRQFIYGLIAYAKDYLRIMGANSLEDASKKKTGSLGSLLKGFLWKDSKK